MAEKQKSQGKPPLSERFADQVALMGVVDAIKAKKPGLKVVWLVIFVVAFVITAFLVYRVVDEYRHNPTATKVTILRDTAYPYPSVVLCLDTWFNMKKAADLGFSKNAVQYALHYLMRFEDVEQVHQGIDKKKACGSLDEDQKAFLETYHRLKYRTLLEFYNHIALDAIQGDYFNDTAVTFDCKGCPKNTRSLKKVVVDRGVCYEIPLMAETGKLRGSDGLWRLSVQAPDLTEGLIDPKPYWRLYIHTHLGQIQPTAMFLSVDKNSTTAVTISGQRFIVADTADDPCQKRTNPLESEAVTCATKCLSEDAARRYGCRVLSLETEAFDRSPTEYCNRCAWQKAFPDSQERTDGNFKECLDGCPHECETWMYDGTVDRHASGSIVAKVTKANANGTARFEAAKIYFKNAAVLRGGILTFTEVFTYSLETLIGTIGGTCGIWIGVGVLTLVQLMVFFVQSILSKAFRSAKTALERRRNRTVSPQQPSVPVGGIQTSRI